MVETEAHWTGLATRRSLSGMPGSNWHTVSAYGVLLVECRACGRRGAIRKEDSRLQMHQGNMKELNRQKFKCRKCGGTEIRAYFPSDHDDVGMFLAGDPVGRMRQAI